MDNKRMKKAWAIITCLILLAGAKPAFAVTIKYSASRYIVGHSVQGSVTASSSVIDITATSTPVAISSTTPSSFITYRDLSFGISFGADLLKTIAPVLLTTQDTPPQTITCTSATPSIVAVSSDCKTVTYISDGTARINASIPGMTRQIWGPQSYTVGTTVTKPNSFSTTSVAYNMNNFATSSVNGLSPVTSTQTIFSSTDDTNHVYVRNASNLLAAKGVDLTCIPAANSTSNFYLENGALIGSDIMVNALHVKTPAGTTFYFVNAANQTFSATLLSTTTIPGNEINDVNDVWIGRLSAPVDSSIHPCPIFDQGELTSATTHFSTTSLETMILPVFFEKAIPYTNDLFNSRSIFAGMSWLIDSQQYLYGISQPASTSPFSSWYRVPVQGDSGSPAFAIVGGKAVIIGTTFGSGVGVSIYGNLSNFKNAVQTAVTSLGSAAIIATTSLSSYPSY